MKTFASFLSAALCSLAALGPTPPTRRQRRRFEEGVRRHRRIQCPKGYECKITATYRRDGHLQEGQSVRPDDDGMLNAHWDSKACACVPNSCVENVLCTGRIALDMTLCECVQTEPIAGALARP